MADLRSAKMIYLKAALFIILGSVASALLIARNPEPFTVLLLVLAVWSFSRTYYFAFYVVERYVDRSYRFSGLISFARYLCKQPRHKWRTAKDGPANSR